MYVCIIFKLKTFSFNVLLYFRYDLLCMEGLVHSMKVFLEQNKAPTFVLKQPASGERQRLIVKENTKSVRPVAVAAVLRNINLNQQAYDSFIDLQVSY